MVPLRYLKLGNTKTRNLKIALICELTLMSLNSLVEPRRIELLTFALRMLPGFSANQILSQIPIVSVARDSVAAGELVRVLFREWTN